MNPVDLELLMRGSISLLTLRVYGLTLCVGVSHEGASTGKHASWVFEPHLYLDANFSPVVLCFRGSLNFTRASTQVSPKAKVLNLQGPKGPLEAFRYFDTGLFQKC